ncbi:ATP-dependent nuclease [Amphiplicatus metriothermophilus]|uniref:Predicted ATP-dependent endonuclease of the OLD family, contains P-loop ATPase and TOPRIM domains n=1 Tax=Amphiplicatus metriothermophilus TaxID=1519374 RepID=A0A239PZI8_9PROT|nr:AAA family ATPase [Amphiplicatus metriothermophilus]MBB5520095.1 energy-coupling factor transporter ATP-binding protein EcfA2 [Amphiplicatus metriothermophilus]SNT75684.1 Predicted ATP-dependent endonuclease of the OLD family, contains P-loop ATPase and TOPRIM domains [Amphiplicatus metriothermophilus]
MRIRHLSVRNFRGIRELDWPVPDRNLLCLIGRGDSTKSTILEALRRAFHPQWNLTFDDADFHLCNPANPITIEAVLGDLPDEFRDLEKYGHWLCGWNTETLARADDPGDALEDALRVRLMVKDDLEPAWTVIKNDEDDGVPFRASDRAKVAVSLIGAISDRHLTWSRGSILSQLTETENISSSLAGAARAAKAALEARRAQDLTAFDAVAETAETTARALGVNIAASYKAHLDTEAINVRIAGLALHDGDMPLRQLGLGSKRMLTTGLQKQALRAPHITLFDEVEVGLEPHRIARLLQHLKQDDTGQYFLTTHSPVVLRELTVADLHIVHCDRGRIDVVAANKPAISDSIQGKIRSGAEAFLAPKIVVCEGATEVGFLRGLDDHWVAAEDKQSFAYRGVALFDANGASKIREIAENLKALGYDVAALADSDEPDQFSDADAQALRGAGVTVAKWHGALSIEERVFADLPWAAVMASFGAARAIWGDDGRLLDQVQTQFGQAFDRNFEGWADSPQLRTALGKAAKTSDWFKRQSWGREWASAISGYLADDAIRASDLVRQLTSLRDWIDNV